MFIGDNRHFTKFGNNFHYVINRIKHGFARYSQEIYIKHPDISTQHNITSLLTLLRTHGLLNNFTYKDKNTISLNLRYSRNGNRPFRMLRIISTAGCRKFYTHYQLSSLVFNCAPGHTYIIRTNMGLMNGNAAVFRQLGGEVLYEIY